MTALKTALIALLTGLAIVAALATVARFGGETSELTEVDGQRRIDSRSSDAEPIENLPGVTLGGDLTKDPRFLDRTPGTR